MGWVTAVSALLVATTLLAGCADDPAPAGPRASVPLATPDTGIIIGIVVDDAIQPISGAVVRVLGTDPLLETTTDAAGAFAFESVPPDTHFVEAEMAGFATTQVSVDVVAGVDDPEPVRIRMAIDVANLPYFDGPFVFDGYVECSVRTPAVGAAACYTISSANGNLSEDNTQVHYPISRKPTYAQSELYWEATQDLGSDLSLRTSWGECGAAFYCDEVVSGQSPLTLPMNASLLDQIFGNQSELYNRIFADDVDATRPPVPICTPGVDGVRDEGCLTGTGVTVAQKFTMFTTLFYGYVPDPEWTYVATQAVPPPPGAPQ